MITLLYKIKLLDMLSPMNINFTQSMAELKQMIVANCEKNLRVDITRIKFIPMVES